ncbi:hypothetical protein [Yinghuangia seranimata]|uniref:hypothetical protein n=1 Tax=Yinghuangia seranimata TaxID=408067 RepID=UPI00248BC406|nr:hypothetical protein [Yinghuangia seranimata]MDI2126041.1 hypothetical protein [Yinghuangia seranimata]
MAAHPWIARLRARIGDGAEAGVPHAGLEALAARVCAARRPLIVAGSGVVDGDAVPGLRALAAEARIGVYNTWRAKGVLPWDSDYHLGTVGLQEHDLELCGLPAYDLVVVTGLDDGELALPGGLPLVECPVGELEILAVRCAGRDGPEAVEAPLRESLAVVVQRAWGGATPPLAPTLITRQYALLLGERGMVAADAGLAGFYLARTFPTLRPRSVVLPAVARPGFAAEQVAARREAEPGLPALAVVDGSRPDDATAAVVAAAAERGIAVPVVCWSPDGPRVGIEDHLHDIRKAVASTAPEVVAVGFDAGQLRDLEAVAGHISVW